MTKQKHGLWVFLFSLIPGAGEMYMGFRKQGISIMMIFWGTIALSSLINLGWLIMFLPILWFYSFFNVHNLKSLSEEDFYAVEDTYILQLDQFIGNTDSAIKKHRTVVAALLIIFGVSILWNNITDLIVWIIPAPVRNFLANIFYRLPGTVIAIAIIAAGIYLLRTKKLQLDSEEDADTAREQKEHYWEPYRPYQQPVAPEEKKDSESHSEAQTESAPAEAVSKEAAASDHSEQTPS